MSRQLKFRTWDKNRQSFIGPINLLGDQKYVVLPENWPWENYCDVINLSISATTLEEATKQRNEYARKNWIVQQFTGLLDSQGKEIYEGDILSKNWRCEVFACGNKGTFMVKFNNHPWKNKDMPLFDYLAARQKAWMSENNEDCEIIGNIFENPELLAN